MIRTVSYASSIAVFLVVSLLMLSSSLLAQGISFDCPALVGAIPILETEESKLIEVPISFSSSCGDRSIRLEKVRAEVCWNRDSFPLTDYGPRTVLQSEIDGSINVEERLESNLSFDGSLTGGQLTALGTPNLNADASRRKSTSNKFARIPEHKLVVSSGPIKRGTGAFFEFHPSPTESLEGGRNLIVAFEVPVSWKAGILQITCSAAGIRKRMGIFNDGIDFERIFIVPVYLKGDDQAFESASTLARNEQQLRSQWHHYRHPSHGLQKNWLASLSIQNRNELSDFWMHHLIQSGSNRALRQVASQLPKSVLAAANDFDRSRKQLLLLNR